MSKLLVVEDEALTSDLLNRYFEIVGYEVVSARTGYDALELAIKEQPSVIILDIVLPDMDGYDVCKYLREDERTNKIPIVFLTRKDDRRDRLEGLELGADDYITKPFDIDELRLRVHNIIERIGGTSLVDARTGLPNTRLTQERLPKLLKKSDSVFYRIEINHYSEFLKQYGPVAANLVIRSTAKLIADILNDVDAGRSFIGHPEDNQFIVASVQKAADPIKKRLPERFSQNVKTYYDYSDQKRGKMKIGEQEIDFMVLNVEQTTGDKIRLPLSIKKTTVKPETPDKAAQETQPTSSDAPKNK